MEIHKGSARIAFVGHRFTAKVPNPKTIYDSLPSLIKFLRKRNYYLIRKWFQMPEKSIYGFKHAIVGFLENWREFRYSEALQDVAVPTHASVFGILNLQDSAPDIPDIISDEQLIGVLEQAVGDLIKRDYHTFQQRSNFGIHNGRVKIRDYGGAKTGPFLKAYRDEFRIALGKLCDA